MNINTAIQVNQFYDDHMGLCEVMVSDQQCDVDSLQDSFCAEYGVTRSGNSYNDLHEITGLFIAYLKKNGFRPLKMQEVLFSD